MLSENLSRRAILAGVASVPALALPAVTAAAPSTAANPDAELVALGEQLKAVVAEADRLDPKPLHEACMDAWASSINADQAFEEMAKQNGYHDAYEKWNAVSTAEYKIAKAILKVPANSRVGDGVRAFAALRLSDHDVDETTEAAEVLWEMAARAGFCPPASIARKLKRRATGAAVRAARTRAA